MINLLTRLAELDDANPNVVNPMNKEQAVVENKKETFESNEFELNVQNLKFLAGVPEVLEECGMMPGAPSTPASMNITASSGEELGSMLKSIMSLAGMQPAAQAMNAEPEAKKDDSEVMRSMLDTMNDGPSDSIETDEDSLAEPTMGGAGAGDESSENEGLLGTIAGGVAGGVLGGPLGALTGAAAGDQLTDPDDEPAEEDMISHKHPMRQMMDKMEEDPVFDNTPEDPTKPPAYDPDKFVLDPNRGDHRERQAGLPRAKPMEAHVESLFSEYEKFIAEAKKCNHSAEGKKCPVHGMEECSGMYEESKPSAGMSKGEKSSLVKKAKAGKDIGKPGKSFDKVAKAAGGGEKGKKIAAAAMWKNAAK